MFLSQRQRDVFRWYFEEQRTLTEIAAWLEIEWWQARQEVRDLRIIFASHGQDLPKFNRGRPLIMPASVPAA